jgi:hypothetical protein
VIPRTGLDNVEQRKFLSIPGLELHPLGRPAISQSLYRLRYPGSGNRPLHYKMHYTTLRKLASSDGSLQILVW